MQVEKYNHYLLKLFVVIIICFNTISVSFAQKKTSTKRPKTTQRPSLNKKIESAKAQSNEESEKRIMLLQAQKLKEQSRSPLRPQRFWYNYLPPCPCTLDGVRDLDWEDEDRWYRVLQYSLEEFHPGAKTSFRSRRTFPSPFGSGYEVRGEHGQQCAYDDFGSLLRSNRVGAGTPDFVSAIKNISGHVGTDVDPWKILGARVYNQYWVPSSCDDEFNVIVGPLFKVREYVDVKTEEDRRDLKYAIELEELGAVDTNIDVGSGEKIHFETVKFK